MDQAELLILDVGHGNAAVYSSGSTVAIIDAGADFTLAEFFERNVSLRRVDLIIISHADEDHLKGLLYLLEGNPGLEVKRIFINPAQEKKSDLWLSFSQEADRQTAWRAQGQRL
jgi:beta-lactamase superfamily II metal-dependent hydrolase